MSVSSPAAGAATIAKILDKSNRAARLVGRIRCAFAVGLNKTFNTENTRNHSFGNVGSDSEVTHRAGRPRPVEPGKQALRRPRCKSASNSKIPPSSDYFISP